MGDHIEDIPDATNFEYITQQITKIKRIFISFANSYHAKAIVSCIFENNDTHIIIYGTSQNYKKNIEQVEILSTHEDILSLLEQLDVIILDISQNRTQLNEAKIILDYLEEKVVSNTEIKIHLILISTIMTWANTPQNDNLSDIDYCKRQPHPCFHEHFMIERRVLNMQKRFPGKIHSVVVCPGIIYGEEQDIFEYIFKECYFNYPEIEIFLPATNILPIIYIYDFAKIIIQIIEQTCDSKYILAVQPETLSVFEIVNIFSKNSESRIRICEQDEIFTMREDFITQRVFNHLTLNLRLYSEYLSDFSFEITGLNLNSHGEKIIQQFYKSRNLKPLKILIDGSSFTPQCKLAKFFSDHYSIHQIEKKNFLNNYKCRLDRKIFSTQQYLEKMRKILPKISETLEILPFLNDAEEEIKKWTSQCDQIGVMLASEVEISFDEMKEFIMERLLSHACIKNQGYVMSDFQLNNLEANEIFDKDTKPDFVIILNRMMELDKECLEIEDKNDEYFDRQSKKDDESEMQRKLKIYYESQYDDTSIENYFLDHGIVPFVINIDQNISSDKLSSIFDDLKTKIGPHMTYELSPKEMKEINKMKQLAYEKELAEKQEIERKKAQKKKEEQEKLLEVINNELCEKKKAEIKEIEKRSAPVREYLNTHVFPHLIDGILELTTLRPNDPNKYLSDYMFQKHFKDESSQAQMIEVDEEIVEEFKKLSQCE
ncbi:hypothetical protein PVAND_001155 [Polypedilum vanderplanki]|uniref:Uncharacterized protein n=1 Tax=Polypedilum vanderplanki TaxID=319348 RepID=A0A9J6BNC9_POLVA|nr:hypothetical protein PVAND_001155 [Polypedilum vanderplanki]